MMGWGESMVNTAIDRDLAHIQIHQPDFIREKTLNLYLPDGQRLLEEVRKVPGVKSAEGRTILEGMASSAISMSGVRIVGIVPEESRGVTDIYRRVQEGSYFAGNACNPILIGKKLADKLHLKLRSKIVLSFQGFDGSIIYAACRVVGIYKTESGVFDQTNVFVRQQDLARLLAHPTVIHEIAVRVNLSKEVPRVQAALQQKFPSLEVKTWQELAPEIAYTASIMKSFTYLFVAIILFALLFGITNTMLMAVLERIRELGVLIAVGMKRGKIFVMILLETVMLSFTGGIGGMLIGGLSIWYLSGHGLDLSAFASSLESFGASTMLYPFLPASMYFELAFMVVAAACIAAGFPAWKAVRLQPATAVRME